MNVKFSEDIIPLTEFKINPSKVVRHTSESHRAVLLTSHGRGVAVMQAIEDYELAEDEKTFMRAVVNGLSDIDNNLHSSISEVKQRLRLK